MRRWGTYVAWVIATLASLISLYFSDIRHHDPCHLCWYQRICLFPLVIILGMACWRGFFGIAAYVIPQVIIGLIFALYQVAIQEIPGWNPIDICGAGPSCAEKFTVLGPITIPMLSVVCFLIIGFFLIFAANLNKKPKNPTHT